MTKFALLGAAALLSAMAATPVTAQEVIYNPAIARSSIRTPTARTRDRTIPTPAIISAGSRFAIRLPGARAPAHWALNSIVAATAAGTIATEKIQNRPLAVDRTAGGLIRLRYPFP
jgi:hypothetical protein